MPLLNLPLELLENIISYTLPLGFEAFALCCKTIYALSQPYIPLHDDYKKKWRRANVSTKAAGDPIGLLYEIALDPRKAEYVEAFNLADWDREAMLAIRHNDEVMVKIKELLITSPYFRLAGINFEEWWTELDVEFQSGKDMDPDVKNDFPFATISLLLHLPNVKEIRFAEPWGSSRWYIDNDAEKKAKLRDPLVASIVAMSHEPAFSGQALSRLETILPFMCAGYNTKTGFKSIAPFVMIPSLKNLYGISLVATQRALGISFDPKLSLSWQDPKFVSNLRRMELAYCCMDGGTLDMILERISKLEVFKYDHETKHHGVEHDWDAASFVETLGRRCGNTLTEVAITLSQQIMGRIENGVDSFKMFERLERLEVDVLVFQGPPTSSGQKRGISGHLPEGAKYWEEANCKANATASLPNLATMLPTSLKFLDLNTNMPKKEDVNNKDTIALKALLKGFREEKQVKLPDLERVVIRQSDAESAKTLSEEAGCNFEVYQGDDSGGTSRGRRGRSIMAKWMRDFDLSAGPIEYEY